MRPDDLWQLWLRRLDQAHQDIGMLIHHRAVWRVLVQMLQTNTNVEHHSVMNAWLLRSYSTVQTVGIRRQRDRRNSRSTLGWVLDSLSRSPQVLSRERYLSVHADEPQASLAEWDACSADDGSYFAASVAETDLRYLDEVCEPLKKYVDEQIAHRKDRDEVTAPLRPSFDELNLALDTLGSLVRKYRYLFRGDHLATIGPMAGWGWLEMFRVGWLPENFSVPDEMALLDVQLDPPGSSFSL